MSLDKENFENKESKGVFERFNSLPLNVRRFIYGIGIVGFLFLWGKVGEDDAEIYQLEQKIKEDLIRQGHYDMERFKAEKINPLFFENIDEAKLKFSGVLQVPKKDWDHLRDITKSFIMDEKFDMYNGIDVFMGELKKYLKKKGKEKLLTSEIENELKLELLNGTPATTKYQDEVNKVLYGE